MYRTHASSRLPRSAGSYNLLASPNRSNSDPTTSRPVRYEIRDQKSSQQYLPGSQPVLAAHEIEDGIVPQSVVKWDELLDTEMRNTVHYAHRLERSLARVRLSFIAEKEKLQHREELIANRERQLDIGNGSQYKISTSNIPHGESHIDPQFAFAEDALALDRPTPELEGQSGQNDPSQHDTTNTSRSSSSSIRTTAQLSAIAEEEQRSNNRTLTHPRAHSDPTALPTPARTDFLHAAQATSTSQSQHDEPNQLLPQTTTHHHTATSTSSPLFPSLRTRIRGTLANNPSTPPNTNPARTSFRSRIRSTLSSPLTPLTPPPPYASPSSPLHLRHHRPAGPHRPRADAENAAQRGTRHRTPPTPTPTPGGNAFANSTGPAFRGGEWKLWRRAKEKGRGLKNAVEGRRRRRG